MKYQKPEIGKIAKALKAIKGTAKGVDSHDILPSNPAYHVDE